MLKDVVLPESLSYTSGDKFDPLKFHLECLMHSNQLDLLLGYFSSSAINLLSVGFASFIFKGGKIRLAINNVLSNRDKESIEKGLNNRVPSDLIDIENLGKIYKSLSKYDQHFFECLAWLISNNKIEFTVISPKTGKGVSHYKEGVYYDDENAIAFSGSPNFTAYGLSENLETIDCFPDWIDGYVSKVNDKKDRISDIIDYKTNTNITYLNIEDIKTQITDKFGGKEINELLIDEKVLLQQSNQAKNREYYEEALEIIEEQIEIYESIPRFPYSEGPREYQIEAYQKWIENDCKGLFAMATGTGKTITSLNCVLNEYLNHGYYKFIVFVPTTALAVQWVNEVENKFNFQNTVLCCSINPKWKDDLKSIGKNIVFGRKVNYAIVTTYATFKGIGFQTLFKDYFEQDFNQITMIADEAHTMGSPGFLRVLPYNINKRIGLSATPERQFDEEGNNVLTDYFVTSADQYTFEYNMKMAIENGVLCRYFYYPRIVSLEREEQEEYLKISQELLKYIDSETGRYRESDYVNRLLIKRKNVIHKAARKINELIAIVKDIGKENFTNAFIYVPEGIEVDYEKSDTTGANDDYINEKLIDQYTEALYNNYQLKIAKFTGETKNRDQILEQFKEGKLDALLAMKCLDEGIDIPQTKYAIFCSSTGNPRQYVQRRGRVLRVHKGKEHAIIYDLIVKPIIDHTNTDEKLTKMEKNIFLSELRRLVNFSVLSENKDSCLKSLEELCYDLDIDIYELANKELENYN